jgi:hypothetical protein
MTDSPHKSFLPRYRARHLLLALGLLFLTLPVLDSMSAGRVVQGLLMTGVMLSALFVVGGRLTFRVGVILSVLGLTSRWLTLFAPGICPKWIFMILAATFFALVFVRVLQSVLSATVVDADTLCACMAGFLLLGLNWALAYSVLAVLDPHAFTFADPTQHLDEFNSFYFSFVTLSTIGYGDITPLSRAARVFAIMEAITGMFYVAFLVARLVSIHSAQAAVRAHSGSSEENR